MKTSKQYSVLIVGIMPLLCLFFLSFLCPSHVFSAAPTAAYLQTISGNLYAPGRIAVDANGNIYVADPRQDKVQVYAADGSLKYTVANFQGTPLGLALDSSNNLYISDARSKSVMVFDSSWNFIRKLGGGDNEFTLPGDIAVSNTGKVYVTDSQNHQVKIYSTSNGAWINTFGGYDPSAAGMFNFPTGITVDDASGEVIVVDEGDSASGRLQRFELNGTYKAGSGFSIKIFPQGITTDTAGRIYVTDTYQGSIYVYDTAGTQLSTIGSWGQLSNPMDVAMDSCNRLLITSSNNARIVIYGIDSYCIPPPCDTTLPATEYSVSASVGQNGWYKSNIRIGLSASDSGETCPGGVSKIEYSFNAATWSECALSQFHCEPLIDVTTDGIIPFYYRATDIYGNVESYKTATLKIDKTPPTLSAFISPSPNANNWNNTDAAVSFTATDNASGVASMPSNVTLTNEGSWQVTGTATDNAGNTTTSSYEVKIDKTPPAITASSSPPANANGWNNTDITVSFNGSDSLSGLAAISQNTTITQDGVSTIIGQAQDFADNIASVNVPYKLDKTGPSITISSPSNNTITKDNVTFNYTVADSLSGVASTEGDASGTTYTAEGAYTKTIKAFDNLGNKSEKSVTFTIDKTPPVITITSPVDNAVSGASIKLEYTVKDATKVTINGDASGTTYTQEGTYIRTIKATDEAGWTTTKTVTFTFIPNTGITTVKTSEPVYTYSVPKPKEAEAKAEAKKEEAVVKAGAAVITITSPKDGLITKDDVMLEYKVEGAEKIEGDASGTVYTKDGAYTKTITAIDKDGGRTTKKVTFIIDKTPPEAEISYDIYSMDIKVSGTDKITKDVLITKSDTGFSYTLTDEAGNALIILFEKMDRDINKLVAKIGSLIYNGAAITPNDNSMDVKIDIDSKTNSVKKISQTYRSKNKLKIIADYDKKKNTTKITTGNDKDKKKDKTASSSGMKAVKVITKSGELSYGY